MGWTNKESPPTLESIGGLYRDLATTYSPTIRQYHRRCGA